MHECIVATAIGSDEAIALVGVEELYGASDSHAMAPSLLWGNPRFGLPDAAEQGKKEKGAAKRQEPSICDCSKSPYGPDDPKLQIWRCF
ncbi:hypothetical protein SPHINGOT1_120268 [Sphingomonas sp. T1]|nr:hypothetical protein SPHINGOT1_120268 [Sphingomonas sp. T1]